MSFVLSVGELLNLVLRAENKKLKWIVCAKTFFVTFLNPLCMLRLFSRLARVRHRNVALGI